MFYRHALRRCAALEEEVASLLVKLAAVPGADAAACAARSSAAAKERSNAKLLRAVAEVADAVGDDGPFLVQVPPELDALTRSVEYVRERLRVAIDARAADALAETLDLARRSELHTSLLEVAEDEVRRLLRRIESETRFSRRTRRHKVASVRELARLGHATRPSKPYGVVP